MYKNCLILLNYNDFTTTNNMLKSVKGYKAIDKIIIVDNYSTDNSFEKLQDLKSSKVEVIKTSENKGYASGNNCGIKYAIEKYNAKNLIVSNPDVYIDEVSLLKVIHSLNKEENNRVAIAAPIMKERKNDEYIISNMSGWKKPSYLYCVMNSLLFSSKVANKLIKYTDNESNDDKVNKKENIKEVFALQGSFFVIKAEAVKRCGYMDEDTFLYFEESILAHRLHSRGYKNIILTDTFYNHDHSVSIDKNIKKKIDKYKILNTSQSIYIEKYLEVGTFKRSLYKVISKIGILERKALYFFLNFVKR